MRVRVKICGVTDAAGVEAAVAAGADAVGFVLADSPRRIEIERALDLAAAVPPFVARVAVLRCPDARTIRGVAAALGPDWIQAETTPEVESALACSGPLPRGAGLLRVVHDGDELLARLPPRAPALLLEAPGRGGRGVAPDWGRAATLARRVRLILAGGLTPENVAAAIRRVRPYGVDVASAVESSPGIKDRARVERFLGAVRRAEADLEETRG